MQPAEIGAIIRVPSGGTKIAQKAQQLPLVEVDYFIQPITRGLLKVGPFFPLAAWRPVYMHTRFPPQATV